MQADEFLAQAMDTMQERGQQRGGDSERSMPKAVKAWWTLFGDNIVSRGCPTEAEMNEFMSILKKARKSHGVYREDDYIDDIGYTGLAGEAASNNQ